MCFVVVGLTKAPLKGYVVDLEEEIQWLKRTTCWMAMGQLASKEGVIPVFSFGLLFKSPWLLVSWMTGWTMKTWLRENRSSPASKIPFICNTNSRPFHTFNVGVLPFCRWRTLADLFLSWNNIRIQQIHRLVFLLTSRLDSRRSSWFQIGMF